MLGGGFGRRSEQDFVADAVECAKLAGAPVKVVWTREDDMRAGWYRPVSYHALEGGLDAEGNPLAQTVLLDTAAGVEIIDCGNPPPPPVQGTQKVS